MKEEIYIAAISTYGTVSNPGNRYVSAIMFSDKEKFLSALIDFLRMQVMIGSMIPEYKEEIGEVNIEKAFSQIREGVNEISTEFDEMLSLNPEYYNRLIVSLPEILTDFHIEFFHPTKDEFNWLQKGDKIGITHLDTTVAIPPCDGEFYYINNICDPEEKLGSGMEQNPNCEGITLIENWNILFGNGATVIPLIKV